MFEYLEMTTTYALAKLGLEGRFRDERGAVTTETAVITFVLVTIAIAVAAILWRAADGQANSIPTTTTRANIAPSE